MCRLVQCKQDQITNLEAQSVKKISQPWTFTAAAEIMRRVFMVNFKISETVCQKLILHCSLNPNIEAMHYTTQCSRAATITWSVLRCAGFAEELIQGPVWIINVQCQLSSTKTQLLVLGLLPNWLKKKKEACYLQSTCFLVLLIKCSHKM